jgi:hypothetical protein
MHPPTHLPFHARRSMLADDLGDLETKEQRPKVTNVSRGLPGRCPPPTVAQLAGWETTEYARSRHSRPQG